MVISIEIDVTLVNLPYYSFVTCTSASYCEIQLDHYLRSSFRKETITV